MIEKIGQETRVSLGKKRLLQSCLFEENYVNIGERFLNSRESFREFSKDATPKSTLEDLMDYYERFKQNLSLFSLSEDDVSFCFVDNKSMISIEKKISYTMVWVSGRVVESGTSMNVLRVRISLSKGSANSIVVRNAY